MLAEPTMLADAIEPVVAPINSNFGYLHHLQLENFKSYAGIQTIGPFDRFTAIIGPNGSGKSNLMDAISFVLGINAGQLRSQNLGELVHRPSTNSITGGRNRAPTRATVLAYYVPRADEPENMVVLGRTVNLAGHSEYRLDGKQCSAADFHAYLASQNILTKARNFLIFQGDVEAVATRSPADLTRLLEQVSGSEEFAQEYGERAEAERKAIEASSNAFQQKRTVLAELRAVKSQREDLGRYSELEEQRQALLLSQMLWRLFHAEREAKEADEAIAKMQPEQEAAKKAVITTDASLASAKRAHAKASKDLLVHERRLKAAQASFDQQVSQTLANPNNFVPICFDV